MVIVTDLRSWVIIGCQLYANLVMKRQAVDVVEYSLHLLPISFAAVLKCFWGVVNPILPNYANADFEI